MDVWSRGSWWARLRPWLAATLGFLYPGLGHVYLRKWLRGLLWFGLAFLTLTVAIPPSAVPASLSEFSVEAVVAAQRAIPPVAALSLVAIRLLNAIDAYHLARRGATERSGGATSEEATPTCPECGREVDPDLDFCQWCTTELDDTTRETDDGLTAR